MPTAEWLSKYESIQDKFACKTEPPAGGTSIIPSTSATRAKSAPCMCASSTLKPATGSRRKEASSDGIAETGTDGGLGERCPGLRERETI